jgi:sterol desaturase/sphingolipid hydroxylase (fatty acid hydroxylase superfamily)
MDIWSIVTAPFDHFVDLSNRMAYLYLLTSLLVAIFAYMINKARKGEAESVSILRWLLPMSILKHPSAQTDYAFYIINKVVLAAIYASILVTAPLSYDALTAVLDLVFGPSTADFEPSVGISILSTLWIILALDFALWLMHYVFHKIPFLWDYHKVHHSAEVLTPITAARVHPLEEVVSSLVAGLIIGMAYAISHYLLGPAAIELTLFEVNIFLAVFYFAAFHLRHSHVWIRFPYWLQHILVCPAQHQIHHSVERKHWDKNMGFIFSVWDWAAGTLYAPKGKEEITFGLGTEEDGGKWHSVRALYFLPFSQNLDRLRGKTAVQPPTEPAE